MADKKFLGLSKEMGAALSYILGPVTGVIFWVFYKDSFVRFHAAQAIVGLGILVVAALVLSFVPLIGSVLSLLYFVALIAGAYNASQGIRWEMPVLGKYAKRFLKS
jgi:uncharacterized membrane protein